MATALTVIKAKAGAYELIPVQRLYASLALRALREKMKIARRLKMVLVREPSRIVQSM